MKNYITEEKVREFETEFFKIDTYKEEPNYISINGTYHLKNKEIPVKFNIKRIKFISEEEFFVHFSVSVESKNKEVKKIIMPLINYLDDQLVKMKKERVIKIRHKYVSFFNPVLDKFLYRVSLVIHVITMVLVYSLTIVFPIIFYLHFGTIVHTLIGLLLGFSMTKLIKASFDYVTCQ